MENDPGWIGPVDLVQPPQLESDGPATIPTQEPAAHQEGGAQFSVDRAYSVCEIGANSPCQDEPLHSCSLEQTNRAENLPAKEAEGTARPELEMQRAADRMVLARFGPPGLMIDEQMNVLQARGRISQFMEITPGVVSWNLLRVLRQDLLSEATSAVQRAIHENVPVSATALMMDEQNDEIPIRIEVLPITAALSRSRRFLVLFQTLSKRMEDRTREQLPVPSQLPANEKDSLIAQLRQDLISTRMHFQSLIEERDARDQEWVSATEQIELANQELRILNGELQQRNSVLAQTANDLTNLLNSASIPLLLLTCDLRIWQFTAPIQRLLSIRPTDIGRSIGEIRLQLNIEDIEPVLTDVLQTASTRELEAQDREGGWHLLRVRPYRTAEDKIEGLAVVAIDIDQLHRSRQHLMDAIDFDSSIFEHLPIAIAVLNEDGAIRTTNAAFRELAQLETKDPAGCWMADIGTRLWGMDGIREQLQSLAKSPAGSRIELEHESTNAQRKTLLMNAQVVSTNGGRAMVVTVEDMTLRRAADLLLGKQRETLEGEIEIATRELDRTQEELRSLTAHLFTVQEEERRHLARELHDDISQRLSLLEIALDKVRCTACADGDVTQLASVRQQVHVLNTDVRQISHRLHPSILSDLGLSAALKAMVKEFGQRERMPVSYLTQDLPESLQPEVATAIYRIAQEALHNVSKHAGRTHVKVLLTGRQGRIQLRVMDFGVGFDQDQDQEMPHRGLGMISMQERARLAGGTLLVQSALGEGTTVTADVPVESNG